MTKPPANGLELPLHERAEIALRAAVEKVIVDSAQHGWPLVIWREGQVVKVSGEELQKMAARILSE